MGKGGGPLSMWLKEFCSLVFVQTLQAFVYAIIITIILFSMTPDTSVVAMEHNSAVGLFSVFALLSVFKVEELSKKIFGIGDTKADHKGAMQSLAKTMVAAQLGKRVLNNVGKIFGGTRKITQARQDRKKATSRFEEDLADNGYEYQDGKLVKSAKVQGARRVNAVSSGARAGGTDSIAVQAPSSGISDISVNATDAGMSSADYRRVKNALRAYEDKASELKKARNEGIKDIFSGVTESLGALGGSAVGGVIAGADGNLDEALRGVIAGAGAGDIVGKTLVDSIDRATKFAQRNINHKRGMGNRQIQKSIKQYKEAIEKAERNYNSVNIDDIEI